MIIRYGIKCKTCGKVYTLRIGMGYEREELFTFPCEDCGQEIQIKLILFPEKHSWKIQTVSNSEETDTEGKIINLDALCPILSENKNSDMYFGRLAFLRNMAEQFDFSKIDASHLSDNTYPITYKEEWEELRKAWELEDRQPNISQKILKNFSLYQEEPLESVNDFIYRFLSKYLGKEWNLYYEGILKFVSNTLYKDIINSQNFLEEFTHSLFNTHKKLVLEICKNYFNNFDYFNPVHLHYRVGIKVPIDANITSNGFNKIKKFYGDSYETLSKLILFVAYVNNLYQGRAHDTFEKLTLKKYKELDNSSKYNCFSQQVPLNYFADGLDNNIRNASHHLSISYNDKDDTITLGTGKSGENKKNITYTEYVQNCDFIFCKIIMLFLIEIVIFDKYTRDD